MEAFGGKVITTVPLTFTVCDTLVKIKRATDYVNPIYTFPKTTLTAGLESLQNGSFQTRELDYSKFTTWRHDGLTDVAIP